MAYTPYKTPPAPMDIMGQLRQRAAMRGETVMMPGEIGEAEARTKMVRSPYDEYISERDREVVDHNEDTQRAEVEGIRRSQLGAWMEGFRNPQEQAGARREMETKKIEAPIREAEIRAKSEAETRAMLQEEQNKRQAAYIAAQNERARLQREAQGGRESTGVVPQQITRDLQQARGSYRNATQGPLSFVIPNSGARERYKGLLTEVLRRSGTLDAIARNAMETAQEGKSAEQALAEAAAEGAVLDPDAQEAFKLFVEDYRRQMSNAVAGPVRGNR